MRFPLKQVVSIAKNIQGKKKAGIDKFPLVLMLEPLFACDLACSGCGRIREYKDVMSKKLTAKDCLDAALECGAPVVSICGGEPLIYPEIGEVVSGLLDQGRVVYLCTNGQKLEESLDTFKPHVRFNFNIHLDGMSKTHDMVTGKSGSWQKAISGIDKAKSAGFNVCTNTTVYAQSNEEELKELINILNHKVDGMLLSPGFEFTDVEDKNFFLHKKQTINKFKSLEKLMRGKKIWSTPRYVDFLTGKRDYPCTPWGNVTYNVKGWKAPCYLITDKHVDSYQDFMSATKWGEYGPGKDKRCENCMAHCGFEATAAMEASKSLSEGLRYARWLLWS